MIYRLYTKNYRFLLILYYYKLLIFNSLISSFYIILKSIFRVSLSSTGFFVAFFLLLNFFLDFPLLIVLWIVSRIESYYLTRIRIFHEIITLYLALLQNKSPHIITIIVVATLSLKSALLIGRQVSELFEYYSVKGF